MTTSILILEDRKTFLENMVQVIQLTNPDVEISSNRTVDAAWDEFHKRKHWDRIIVDLMVPNGKLFSAADTSSGLDTGQAFVELMIKQSGVSFDQIIVHSARNRGLWASIANHPKVIEKPKTEMNHVSLAAFLFGDDSDAA